MLQRIKAAEVINKPDVMLWNLVASFELVQAEILYDRSSWPGNIMHSDHHNSLFVGLVEKLSVKPY